MENLRENLQRWSKPKWQVEKDISFYDTERCNKRIKATEFHHIEVVIEDLTNAVHNLTGNGSKESHHLDIPT